MPISVQKYVLLAVMEISATVEDLTAVIAVSACSLYIGIFINSQLWLQNVAKTSLMQLVCKLERVRPPAGKGNFSPSHTPPVPFQTVAYLGRDQERWPP